MTDLPEAELEGFTTQEKAIINRDGQQLREKSHLAHTIRLINAITSLEKTIKKSDSAMEGYSKRMELITLVGIWIGFIGLVYALINSVPVLVTYNIIDANTASLITTILWPASGVVNFIIGCMVVYLFLKVFKK